MQNEHTEAITSLKEQLEKDKEDAISSLREQLEREHKATVDDLKTQVSELKESLTSTLEQTQLEWVCNSYVNLSHFLVDSLLCSISRISEILTFFPSYF